mgnify:CR=1 FL=1
MAVRKRGSWKVSKPLDVSIGLNIEILKDVPPSTRIAEMMDGIPMSWSLECQGIKTYDLTCKST